MSSNGSNGRVRRRTSYAKRVPLKEDAAPPDDYTSSTPSDEGGVTWGSAAKSTGIVPLLLLLVTPFAAIWFWYMFTELDGNGIALIQFLLKGSGNPLLNIFNNSMSIWPRPTAVATQMVLSFMAVQLALMRVVPGRPYTGPVTATGHVPQYNDNGLACHLISLGLFLGCSDALTNLSKHFESPLYLPYSLNLFHASLIYDRFGECISFLVIFALVFCSILYLKGLYAPSTTDHHASGNALHDYFWGTELYPRIFGFDVKMFTNCRFGLMTWSIISLSYMAAQYDRLGFVTDAMMVSVALQVIYCTKFFVWEAGYMSSIDIMHDSAGYYLCWGCLVWVPSVYTYCAIPLVKRSYMLGTPLALGIFLAGIVSIYINYASDYQRQEFRRRNGDITVWFGQKPEYIEAHYQTAEGEQRTSLLLCSGWWGIARHFHYIPELCAAFCWCVPGMFGPSPPWMCLFYFVFLTILLTHRAFRDDTRCALKYGEYWAVYCVRVPYKILPGIL